MSEPWSGRAVVYGKAATQGSKRVLPHPTSGRPLQVEANPRLKSWRSELQREMLAVAPPSPLDVAFRVTLTVSVARPQAHYDSRGRLRDDAPECPMSGLDLDKVARACGDAGSRIWWRDDARIVEWQLFRRWSPDGREQTEVAAWVLEDPAALKELVRQRKAASNPPRKRVGK